MRRPTTERRTALVTDAGRGSALCIIRSLGRRGWRVIAVDSDPHSLGFRSKYVQHARILPSSRGDPTAFVDALQRIVTRDRVDLVVPVTDDAIHPLLAARERFGNGTRLALPNPDAFRVVNDKGRTVALAERLGVPVPRSIRVSTVEQADRALDELTWPVVIKPVSSRHWGGRSLEVLSVSYAGDRAELLARAQRAEGRYDLLLQEYCAGEGHGVEMLAHEGRVLAAFQHRRLAEIPLTGGVSAWRESVALDPELYRYAQQLVAALSWTGPIMIEFKVGAGPRLMEINGRVWGSMPLAVTSGVDFPARWAELCMDGPDHVARTDAYDVGVRVYNLELLLMWIVNVSLGRRRHAFLPTPDRLDALAALRGLLPRGDLSEIAASDDPGPAAAQLPRIARKLASKLGFGRRRAA